MPDAFNEIGVQLPLLITGWIAVGLFIFGLLCLVVEWRVGTDDIAGMTGAFAWIFAVFTLGVWVCLLIPFDGKYQHYYEVSGHVESVSNVIAESDDGLTRVPVVTLDNVRQPLTIDDPRAVTLLDTDVTLRCTIGWNYQAADTYDCRIAVYGD